jgi:hypothetical protein
MQGPVTQVRRRRWRWHWNGAAGAHFGIEFVEQPCVAQGGENLSQTRSSPSSHPRCAGDSGKGEILAQTVFGVVEETRLDGGGGRNCFVCGRMWDEDAAARTALPPSNLARADDPCRNFVFSRTSTFCLAPTEIRNYECKHFIFFCPISYTTGMK